MGKKLTLEQARQRCLDYGFEPLFDKYVNSSTKILVRCRCRNKFETKLHYLSKIKSCGHCNDPKIGDKFGRLTVIEVIPSPHNGCSVKCRCDCGNIWGPYKAAIIKKGNTKSCGHCSDPHINDRFGKLVITEVIPNNHGGIGCRVKCKCDCGNLLGPYNFSEIKNGHTKSCGHCNDPKVGNKFSRLTVIEVKPSPGGGCSVKCQCDCGNICGPYQFKHIKNNNTKSCGHCNDPKVGDKFGRLTVIEIIPVHTGGCRVKCRCDCGELCGPYFATRLKNNRNTSCGYCQLKRNGKTTSYTALELHDIIEKILQQKCQHNYYINGKCVDIVCPELKIAVEFDGYYRHRVHRDTTELEKQDEKKIRKNGYKFLRIRSDGTDIPTEARLRKVLLNHFEHGYKKWTITMKSWKNKNENL
jgi:very-short-patch-repair endonuclease